ncbi:MAG: PAS domain S-box protein [Planctomycetota bacterium]
MSTELNRNGAGDQRVGGAYDDGRFRRLIEGVQKEYIIYGNDLEGRLTYVSPSAKAVLGYEAEDLIGCDWRDLVPCAESRASAARHQDMAFQGLDTPPNLVEVNHADGSRRLLEVLPTAVRNADGEIIGVEGICKDVTELKRAEKELVRLTQQLDKRVRDRTAELHRRVEFENLLVTLSTAFINLPVSQIDAGMQDAIRRIGEFAGVDRCFIYNIDAAAGVADLTHEWVAPGVPSVQERMQGVPLAGFAWELNRLQRDRVFHIPDVEALPAQASALQRLYRELGVRSGVNVPLMRGEDLIGLLGFVSIHETRQWSDDDTGAVQVLAEVLVNTLDRYRAEKALRASEHRYRGIVEDQVDMIVRWRPDGTQTFVNEAVCRFHNQPREAVLGKSVYEGIHPADRRQVEAKIAGLTPDRPFATDEHRVTRHDGVTVWMQWVDRALFDGHGRAVEYQSIGRDVTELREAQETLQSRLELERLILDISLTLVHLPGAQAAAGVADALRQIGEYLGVERCKVCLFNEARTAAEVAYEWSTTAAPPLPHAACRLDAKDHSWALGPLLAGEPLHVPTLDVLPDKVAAFAEQLRASGVRSLANVPMVADGRTIGYVGAEVFTREKCWNDDELALLQLTGGALVNFLLREEAERELRLSEERLRLTIETVEDGLFDLNVPDGVLFVSDHTLRTYGLPAGENDRSAEKWRSLVHPHDRERVEKALDDHLHGEAPFYEVEYRLQNQDGSYGWRHARGRVVKRDAAGAPLRMLGVDRDVSERVAQQQKTHDLEAQLVHLGRVATMGETVAGIAHEVNQPLHAAATFSAAARRALASGRPDALAKGADLAQKIGEQVSRAGDIIRRLRAFTRPQPSPMQPVDIAATVEEATALLSHVSNRRDVRIDLDLPESLPPVEADPVQLQQVVVNLLQNAYDSLAQSPGGDAWIRVTAEHTGGELVLTIRDNGPESPVNDPEEMFDPFFTTKPGGMGIGLSLCRTIIAGHNGRIEAAKPAGGGMAITVRLPVGSAAGRAVRDAGGAPL